MPVTLCALYAPATRPDRFDSAARSGADCVIVDLEDAVAASRKAEAREQLSLAATSLDTVALQVRINAAGTPWHAEDCAAIDGLPAHVGVRIPKCEDVGLVQHLAQRWPGRGLHVLIESALGLERSFELAQVTGVSSIGLGEADLRSSLGGSSTDGLWWARGRIISAAAAAGLGSPMGSAYTTLHDDEGLRADTIQLRSLGFCGRTVIHPQQISVVREAFRPSEEEVLSARTALAAVTDADVLGSGTAVLPDGRFLDSAMINLYRRILAIADLY